MNLFFGIFLILTGILPLSCMGNGEKGVRAGVMLLPPAISRREQERGRSARFVARIRDFASAVGKGRSTTYPCRIRMQRNLGCVQIKCDDNGAEILMEEDFSILSARREDLHLLAGWLLLLENGILPHKVRNKEFYTSFLVTAVTRRAFMDVRRRSLPYPDYFPCARTLAARGLFPTLAQSLSNPGQRVWSSCMSLYSEYCELIFLGLLRSRGFDRSSYTKLLAATAFSPEKSQKDHFFELLRMERKKKKGKKELPPERTIPPEALESWYSAFLKRALQSPMQPLALEYWESRYREILSFEDGESGISGRIPLASSRFPVVFKGMKEPDKKVFQILRDLLLLGNQSPLALREELHTVRKCFLQYRKGGMNNADLQNLLAAEKRLFSVLEREYALREFLEETERRSFPPTLLFQRTLHSSRSWEAKEKENMGKRFSALFARAGEALTGKGGSRL